MSFFQKVRTRCEMSRLLLQSAGGLLLSTLRRPGGVSEALSLSDHIVLLGKGRIE